MFCLSVSSGPGPVDTPTVRGLHPRTVSVTWAPPSQTNGIITNYTLYLHPGSFISSSKSSSITNSSLTLSPHPVSNLSTLFSREKTFLNPDSTLMTSFSLSDRQDSVSLNNTSFSNASSAIQDTLKGHFSTLRPPAVEGGPTEPSHATSTSPDRTAVLFYPEELNTSSGNPDLSRSTAKVDANGYDPGLSMKQDLISSSSRSTFLSVTVPGNVTTYTFLNLRPYRTYSLQVLQRESSSL